MCSLAKKQASDMLNCHQIGAQSFQIYIKYHILKQPSSTNAPIRRNRLLTQSTIIQTEFCLHDRN